MFTARVAVLAIRPPEYFPRLAYFALMLRADRFVLADTFQYSRQSYQNRTRIASPDGSMWLSVPLVGGQHGMPIQDVEIDRRSRWPNRHLKALQFNYGKAPFYDAYLPLLADVVQAPYSSLGALTTATVRLFADLFHLPAPEVLSDLPGVAARTLAETRDTFGDAPLLALPDTAQHDNAIPLDWHEAARHQPFGAAFLPGCSALDALMMYGPAARDFL